MEIEWAPSPNYSKGRKGKKIVAIVNHITAGAVPGCLSWMRNPRAKASAHYLITRQGKIYQMVRDEDTSWHAGMVNKPKWKLYDGSNPNYYTLGIEHECLSGGLLTDAQYKATVELHKMLITKYNIPVDRDHIIGHYGIDGVNRPNCPGPNFPWNKLFNDLKGSEEVPEWMKKLMDKCCNVGLMDPNYGHKLEDTATKWFALAVVINAMLIILKALGKPAEINKLKKELER